MHKLSIIAASLVLAHSAFALMGIDIVTKDSAKELGLVIRSNPAGPQALRVELEFETKGKLANFQRVDLILNEGDESTLHATLKEESAKAGQILVGFAVARTDLDKVTLRIVTGSGGRSMIGYDIPVKDFVEAATADGLGKETPAIIVYTTGGSAPSRGADHDQVVTAIWPDGRIVWSADHIQGGAPFKHGKCSKDKLSLLLQKLEVSGAFTNQALEQIHFGPDARYTCIAIRAGTRRLTLHSWHELFEQNSNLVATSTGVGSLGGRSREEVLGAEPPAYRQFRQVWSEIRAGLSALTPATGEPFTGAIHIPKN